MANIPDEVIRLYQMYGPRDTDVIEDQNKQLRGSVDSLIHLVVGMMIANDLTLEKIQKLGDTIKGSKNARN